MKNRIASMLVCLLPLTCAVLSAQDAKDDHGNAEPPALGIHWAKGQGPSRTNGSPDMTYHGGPILQATSVTAIFWGPSWLSSPGDKINGMDLFYKGIGASNYAGTCNEYTDSSKNQVGSSISYTGHIVDTSTPPSNGNRTSLILAEVCRIISASQLDPKGYYPVYIDNPRVGGYCAWHSYGSCNGVTVQFGFFYKLDGDPGCDPQSSVTTESQGLAALANVSGHEISETRTDPHANAWYDSGGSENADKCAWTFGTPYLTFFNGTQWKIQGNLSNNAYNSGMGYPNSNGQKGCIDGGNF
jgi:hypothetical protein